MPGLPFGMDIKLAFKGMHLSLLVSVTYPPVRMLVCFLVGRLSRKMSNIEAGHVAGLTGRV